ncbi:uncharacterized protein LOC114537149 [Dendronephthya gigantea]|uniref:uncharacterized protein LOC114537149 n=1 Tax=Dendronephthya gigantea TaxID=151771 RepID=UPI00106AA4A5|nr:uncharacterized protein LOC114537149 [Dendronephthya gigantea]
MRFAGTKHITSSPLHAQSNGRAENAVKTAKNLMKKSKEACMEYFISLLSWRNTPTEGMDTSPAQRMFGRRTLTQLPTAEPLLKPQPAPVDVRKQILTRKEKQASYYNRQTKELPTLKEGQVVRITPQPNDREKKWIKGQVTREAGIRSYEVITEDGRQFRRNRKHLRASKEQFYQPDKQPPPVSPSSTPPPLTPPKLQVQHVVSPGKAISGVTRSGRVFKPPSCLD